MRILFWLGRFLLASGALLTPALAAAQTPPPLAGCYERLYDAAHLTAHKGQRVVRVTLSVTAASAEMQSDKTHAMVANGDLKIWVRGRSASFDSLGACARDDEGLLCAGSLSAAETAPCKSPRDGVRSCRIDADDAGSFHVAGKRQCVLVTIRQRLELPSSASDSGPYLYLSPGNAEDHAFLLKKTSKPCK